MLIRYSDDHQRLVVNKHSYKHTTVLISAVIAVYAVIAIITMAQTVVDRVHYVKAARHAALK